MARDRKRKKLRFPIRFKILIALLMLVTVVVGAITFTMANLFHSDKTAYIHDLTSMIATHTAEETRALLVGYLERTRVFTRLMYERDVPVKQKRALLKDLFEDSQDFVAVIVYEEDREPVSVYNADALENAGLKRSDLLGFGTAKALEGGRLQPGRIHVENFTLSPELPMMVLSMAEEATGRPFRGVAAVIRLDRLLNLAKRSQAFETFIIDAQGNVLAHPDPRMIAQGAAMEWLPAGAGLEQIYGVTREYLQDGVPMIGGFAHVAFSDLLVGAQIPRSAAYLTARELLKLLLGVALIILILSGVSGLYLSRRITRPIERLSEATEVIGKGQFDVNIDYASRDEIGDLASSFNHMAQELDTRERKLNEAQEALIQSEKMAAFGQLGAGIAHEIKNPLAGILGFAQLSLRKMPEDGPVRENLMTIEKETKRCKTIIENLMKFARQEKTEFGRVDLNRVVEEAAAIVDHQLGLRGIQVQTELAGDLPDIEGNANQLQQVLINLLINAEQAMEDDAGMIRIASAVTESGEVEVRLTDTGRGMPPEVAARIFEPFYTTKPVGEGTGLGLSVSYGIVKDHGGDIHVKSKPGEGTTFLLSFPAGSDDSPENE